MCVYAFWKDNNDDDVMCCFEYPLRLEAIVFSELVDEVFWNDVTVHNGTISFENNAL